MERTKYRFWDTRKRVMYVNCPDLAVGPDGHVSRLIYRGDCVGWEGTYYSEHIIPLQYTGLNDKSGKEIYEGDIIREHINTDEYLLAETVFSRGCFMGKEPRCDPEYPIYDFSDGEVIGNIYENPELLEVRNERN